MRIGRHGAVCSYHEHIVSVCAGMDIDLVSCMACLLHGLLHHGLGFGYGYGMALRR